MIRYIWDHGVIWSFAFSLAAGLAAAVARAHKHHTGSGEGRRDTALAFASAAAVALILAVSLTRYGLPSTLSLRSGVQWAPDGWSRFSSTFGHSEEITLNVLLYVPAGAALTLWMRGRLAALGVLCGLTTLSAVVEAAQGALTLGTPDVSDVAANFTGAYLGVTAGALAIAFTRHRPAHQIATAVVLVALGAGAAAAITPLAARHQDQMAARLQHTFAGTTLADYRSWDHAGTLDRRVFDVGSTFSDGVIHQRQLTTVRYPTSYLGLTRCLYVAWSPTGVSVTKHSGNTCSTFLG